MKIGAQLYTVREFTQTNKDFANTMKKISEIGYNCVQISAINPEIPANEIAETCKAYGLDVVITHTNPQRVLKETAAVIAEHRIMGAKYIGIGSLPSGYNHDKNGFRSFVTDFIPVARMIKQAGLQFMYHNHMFEFARFGNQTFLEYVAERFPEVGFTLDTFWVQAGGADPAEYLKKFTGRVDVVHLKDFAVVENQRRMAEVMEGNLNWTSIFAAMEEAGVKYAMVEQDDCYGKDPFDCLRTSLTNLKKVRENV